MVLIALALILAGVVGVADGQRRQAQATRMQQNRLVAYYEAQAGVSRARVYLRQPGSWPLQGEFHIGGSLEAPGTYTVVVDASNRLVATGIYGDGALQASRVIRGTVRVEGGQVLIEYDR